MSSTRYQFAAAALVAAVSAIPSGYPMRPTGSGGPWYGFGNETGIWATGAAASTGLYPTGLYPTGYYPGGPSTETLTYTNTVGETIVKTVTMTGAGVESIVAAAAESTCLSEVTSTVTHKVTVTVTGGAGAVSSPLYSSMAGVAESSSVAFVLPSGSSAIVVPAAVSSTQKAAYGAHGHQHGHHGHSKFHHKSSATPVISTAAGVASSAPVVYSPASSAQAAAVSSLAPVESSAAAVVSSASPVYSTLVVSTPAAESSAAPVSSASTPSDTCSSRPSAPGVSGSGKRGAAYNDVSLCDAFSGSSEVTWAYNWGFYKDDGLPSSMEYIPMMWGMEDWATSSFNETVKDVGYTTILGFNEPDMYYGTDPNNKQADMTAETAAANWGWMEQFSCQARLGSPAVTNGAAPMGLSYLEDFFSACTDCTVDFVILHWYGGCDYLDTLKSHVEDAWTKFQKPIWVTEFSPNDGDDSQKAAFLQSAQEYLDGNEHVERYAYYMVSDGALVSGTSTSTIGAVYAAS